MKLFRSLRLIAALIIASASLSTSVDAFSFGGMFKKLSHHAGKTFKSFSHHPVGKMFMQAGKQYAMGKIAQKTGLPPNHPALQMAGGLFDSAAKHLARSNHHQQRADHFRAQGDDENADYHQKRADQHRERHEHYKSRYNDHIRNHPDLRDHDIDGDWDSHMDEHANEYEGGKYASDDEEGDDYGGEDDYDGEEGYEEDEEYNSDEDDDW